MGLPGYSSTHKLIVHPGDRYEFCNILFWAEGGMVCQEDTQDDPAAGIKAGDYKRTTPWAYLDRAKAFAVGISRLTYADERKAMRDLVHAMVEVATRAYKQGCAVDPTYREQWKRHRSQSGDWIQVPKLPGDMRSTGGLLLGKEKAPPKPLIIPGQE